MVTPISERFNPDLLARETARYSAELPVAKFTRLSECLVNSTGEVEAEFSFTRRKDHVLARGQYNCTFPLECQRCLQPMSLPIEGQFELTFVENEAAAQGLPDAMDPVVLDDDGFIDVVGMLEDELMLQLPVVPRHEMGSDECAAKFDAQDSQAAVAPPTRKPFAVLENLKKDMKFDK